MGQPLQFPIQAELQGRDLLKITESGGKYRFEFVACREVHSLILEMKNKHGADLKKWPMPEGATHGALLVKELLLKIQGQWSFPYPHDELCHCRTVPVAVVDQAIVAGAHTPEAVSRWTSASTACGTCRPEVEKILAYRLGTSK